VQSPADKPNTFRLARLLPILLAALSLSGMRVEPDVSKIDPLLRTADAPVLADVQREVLGAAVRESVSVPAFLRLSDEYENLPGAIGALGGSARQIHDRMFIVHLPANALRYVSNWPHVAYIEAPRNARPLLDRSRPAVSADVVQSPGTFSPPFDGGITGAGAFIGVVDTGLSVAHPDFRVDGPDSSLRVARLSPNQGTASVDTDGHGTHVTGIAAGSGFASGGLYTGMGPGAEILVWKTTFNTADVVTGAQDLAAFGEAQGRPVAVNLSLGTSLGPHDGTSAFESGINAVATGTPVSRRIVAAAAGNGGTGAGHFGGSVAAPFGSATVSLTFKQTNPPVEVQVWADGEDRYTATVTLTTNAGNLIDTVSVSSGSAASSPERMITVFNRTAAPPNGATFIDILFSPPAGARGTIRLDRTRNGGSGRIDAYVDESEGTFSVPTPSGTITEPANAENVLAAGSFNTKQPANEAISSFSSRGPTRDGRLKPDLTAPGRVLFSTRSLEAPAGNYDDIVDDNYAVLTGTSMSAPHVAGIAALVWESNPSLTGARMRERLRKTADPVPPSPNLTWGFGKIDALSAVTAPVAAIAAPATARPGDNVALSAENSSGAFGFPLAFSWSLTERPPDSAAVLSSNDDATSFTPDVPGIYAVALTVSQANPAGTPAGGASAVIHVNNVPVAGVSGPAPDIAGIPVLFVGSGTDADDQDLTFHWVLVERPGASEVTGLEADGNQAVLLPDVEGTYVVGLRVDDGLDSSALALSTYTTFGALSRRTGGGGCSLPVTAPGEAAPSAAASFLLLVFYLPALAIRKRMRRIRK
jgi:subtilisin family serine protease